MKWPYILVSIPPRKVSRPYLQKSYFFARFVSIPPRKVSRQGQVRNGHADARVSIPPRKVSRSHLPKLLDGLVPGFHSTKEGFKGVLGGEGCRPRSVSIPPRKVSRIVFEPRSVHFGGFPFHQGRFQGRCPRRSKKGRRRVSIPPRKVSRRPRGLCPAPEALVSIPPRKVSR